MALEEQMKDMKNTAGQVTVETALAQVRALADRSTSTNASLIASLEVLSDQASINNHADKEHYKIALKAVRGKEKCQTPLQGLVVKLIGSDAAKKVNASVDSWLKANKKTIDQNLPFKPPHDFEDPNAQYMYNTTSTAQTISYNPWQPQSQFQYQNNWQSQQYPRTPWYGYQASGPQTPWRGSYRGPRFNSFRGRGAPSRGSTRLCFACKSPDHLMDKCPRVSSVPAINDK
jgi:hypothetical protein